MAKTQHAYGLQSPTGPNAAAHRIGIGRPLSRRAESTGDRTVAHFGTDLVHVQGGSNEPRQLSTMVNVPVGLVHEQGGSNDPQFVRNQGGGDRLTPKMQRANSIRRFFGLPPRF